MSKTVLDQFFAAITAGRVLMEGATPAETIGEDRLVVTSVGSVSVPYEIADDLDEHVLAESCRQHGLVTIRGAGVDLSTFWSRKHLLPP